MIVDGGAEACFCLLSLNSTLLESDPAEVQTETGTRPTGGLMKRVIEVGEGAYGPFTCMLNFVERNHPER